jgi:hypothetical protein
MPADLLRDLIERPRVLRQQLRRACIEDQPSANRGFATGADGGRLRIGSFHALVLAG